MAEAAPEIDPQIVDDLRTVEAGSQTLGSCGIRAEFWELFTLLKTGRDLFTSECDRLAGWVGKGMTAKADPELVQHLGRIKEELHPLARRLRDFLEKSAAGILDGMKQDLALVFLMGSAKARTSVSRWVTDPAGSAAESALRLKILSRLVDGYRRALMDARRTGAPPPPPPDTTVRSMSPAPPKLKAEFIDDLQYVDRCRRLLQGTDHAPAWELICLMLLQREETRRTIDELAELKTNGKPGEFAGASHRLRTQLRQIHGQFELIEKPVRVYLKNIFGAFDTAGDELALAFLLASSQGRHRAKQWLDDPELCKGEATASMNGLRARALSYLRAVKASPQSMKA